ncbi:unnamed protein product [marine sediment metagenome]|uniref:Uncharacterized protein n=1 Tax=marine sediment metagenome TaxID=412755 RepID=X1M9N5_9ZZZZ
MKQKAKAVVLNARDNVATALADLEAGTSLELEVGGKYHVVSSETDHSTLANASSC